jgi:hypothetical protein
MATKKPEENLMTAAIFDSNFETFGGLQELYANDVEYQEHIQSSLYNKIRKVSSGDEGVQFDGLNFNVPVKLTINESYAAIVDGERLPESGMVKEVFAKYRAKLMYSTAEATQFAATRGHNGGRAGGKYMDDLLKGTLLSFMSNLDFDLYGNGRGYRATVDTATAAAASFTAVTTARIRPEMKFDWYDSTYATKRGSIMIAVKGTDRMARKPYIDSTFGSGAVPAGAVAGDKLVVYGALAANEPTDGRYICGLERMTDNSLSLGSLSPSTYAQWMSTNQSAANGNISQELLQLQFDSMYIIGGKYPKNMVFNPGQKRSYLSQFLNQRRFNSNNFDTGASALTFSPLKMGEDQKNMKPTEFDMLEDKNCEPDVFYFWHPSAMMLGTDYSDAPSLADEDGSEFRFRQGYDSLSSFYRFWANTVVKQRNLTGKISGLAIPSGVI